MRRHPRYIVRVPFPPTRRTVEAKPKARRRALMTRLLALARERGGALSREEALAAVHPEPMSPIQYRAACGGFAFAVSRLVAEGLAEKTEQGFSLTDKGRRP